MKKISFLVLCMVTCMAVSSCNTDEEITPRAEHEEVIEEAEIIPEVPIDEELQALLQTSMSEFTKIGAAKISGNYGYQRSTGGGTGGTLVNYVEVYAATVGEETIWKMRSVQGDSTFTCGNGHCAKRTIEVTFLPNYIYTQPYKKCGGGDREVDVFLYMSVNYHNQYKKDLPNAEVENNDRVNFTKSYSGTKPSLCNIRRDRDIGSGLPTNTFIAKADTLAGYTSFQFVRLSLDESGQ